MKGLTPKQAAIVEFIRSAIAAGAPPTRSEMCEHFGWASPNAAQNHLVALQEKGAIQILPGRSRGVRLSTC